MGHGSLEAATGGWYSEVGRCAGFPGCEKSTGGAVGHFTAMVWKGVKELGCGINAAKRIYVCRYKAGDRLSSDTPNMQGAYKANVLAANGKTEAECAGTTTTDPPVEGPGQTDEPTAVPTGVPRVDPACKDLRGSSCISWKRSGYCTQLYVSWMKTNCAKTCNHCDGGTGVPLVYAHVYMHAHAHLYATHLCAYR